jgi:4-hydroxybenzoate polyprenyltransferase
VKVLNRFVDLLLYTSIFAACCAVGLCMATERFIDGMAPELGNSLHILIFGSTLLVYNTPRLVSRMDAGKEKRLRYRVWHFVFFFVGLVLTAAGLYLQPVAVLAASGVLGVFAFAYFLPLLPFKNKKRLRDFGGLKIIVLTGVWTTATSILPMLYWQKPLTAYPFEIVLRFVFVFALCVAFDIRDIRADLRNNISTLPNKVGLRNSYRLINLSLLLFAGLSVVQYLRYPDGIRLAGALLTSVITWAVVGYLRNNSSDRAYLLLADGVMLLYALLVLVPD